MALEGKTQNENTKTKTCSPEVQVQHTETKTCSPAVQMQHTNNKTCSPDCSVFLLVCLFVFCTSDLQVFVFVCWICTSGPQVFLSFLRFLFVCLHFAVQSWKFMFSCFLFDFVFCTSGLQRFVFIYHICCQVFVFVCCICTSGMQVFSFSRFSYCF